MSGRPLNLTQLMPLTAASTCYNVAKDGIGQCWHCRCSQRQSQLVNVKRYSLHRLLILHRFILTVYNTMEAKPGINMWIILGVLVLVLFILFFLFKQPLNSSAPSIWWNQSFTDPAAANSPPVTPRRELAPAPLYEEHRDDRSLPDNAEVERHTDGYSYLKPFTNLWNRSNRSAE